MVKYVKITWSITSVGLAGLLKAILVKKKSFFPQVSSNSELNVT